LFFVDVIQKFSFSKKFALALSFDWSNFFGNRNTFNLKLKTSKNENCRDTITVVGLGISQSGARLRQNELLHGLLIDRGQPMRGLL
jgi:hypothetical protein